MSPRISRTTGAIMMVTAVLFDFAQFILTLIPFVGWIISWILGFCAWCLFFLWFNHYGVNLFASNRALGTLGAMLGEAVPFINGFFWWTLRVWVVLRTEGSKAGA